KCMLNLKNECLHATTNKPYALEACGSKDSLPEGYQARSFRISIGKRGGLIHGSVVKFANEEDRTYQVEKNPVHMEFGKCVGQYVAGIRYVILLRSYFHEVNDEF
ncbi:hypothetical protein BJ878DRAFT_411410, partial [Calycina marina]